MNVYKAMNIPLSVIVVAELFSVFTESDALLGWNWGAESKHKQHHSETCYPGQCVQAWKCPKYALSEKYSSSCSGWSNEPLVCCMTSNDESSHHLDKTYSYESTISDEYIKPTSPYSWKQTTKTNTKIYGYTRKVQLNKSRTEGSLDKNSRERPTTVSSLGDILVNVHGKFSTSRPFKRVTNNIHDDADKRTFFSQAMKTTSPWYKPSVSGSRITFPTESTSMPKITKYATRTTQMSRRTFDSNSTKSKTWSTHSTTTIPPFRYTTRKVFRTPQPSYSEKSTKSTTSHKFEARTTKNWYKSTTALPTRGQTTNSRITSRPVTTRRYESTTALPDVNEFLCGLRNQPLSTRRQKRNIERKTVSDFVLSDVRGSKNRQSYQRIVGGKEVEPFSWPWVVALFKVTSSGGNRFLSAGSLINENFVLTAAHIFTPDDLRTASFVVMLGTHDAQDAVAEYLVSSVLQHPRYEQRYYYHDIALLKLHKSVIFNNYIMPVCLPSPKAPLLNDRDLQGKNVTVMGWGDDSFGGKSSSVLKEATFPIVSRVSCNTSYVKVASNRFPKGITSDMLCAGDPSGRKDACQGDSGGPLTSVENGRYTQVGIVSFGYKCGDKEYPGVYTKVAPYLSWIAQNTRRDEDYMNYDY